MDIDFNTAVGFGTMLISAIGFVFTVLHVLFYRRANNRLANRMRWVFLTDSMIYMITLLFGLWAFFDWGFTVALGLHILRIPLLLLNIAASYRLFRLYAEISKLKH